VVHNSRPHGVHTDMVMGNGHMPNSGNSAVVKAYTATTTNRVDINDMAITMGVTLPKCYNVAILG
jgi:hypothetical protein